MSVRPTPILVLRSEGEFSASLRREGFDVLTLELVATRPVADVDEFEELRGKLYEFDGIFVTGRAAAEILVENMTGSIAASASEVFVLGERSRKILEGRGLRLRYSETANSAEELLREVEIANFERKRVLFIRGDRSMRTIPTLLSGIAEVEEATVYETYDLRISNEGRTVIGKLTSREIEWLCFFSPSGVE